MRYIGRILGAVGGVALFPNLITVILGFVCGMVFDHAAQKSRRRHAESLVYQNLCLNYLALAAALGALGRNPQAAWQALRPQLVGRGYDITLAERYFQQCLRRPSPIDALADELYALVDGQHQQLDLLLSSLHDMAQRQGYSPTQQRVLAALAELFDLDLPQAEPQAEPIPDHKTRREEPPPLPLKTDALGGRNPYFVLGVASTATVAEIKSAYRKLVAKHHPDKLSGQGAGAKVLAEAEEKMRVYNAAYDMLTKRQKE